MTLTFSGADLYQVAEGKISFALESNLGKTQEFKEKITIKDSEAYDDEMGLEATPTAEPITVKFNPNVYETDRATRINVTIKTMTPTTRAAAVVVPDMEVTKFWIDFSGVIESLGTLGLEYGKNKDFTIKPATIDNKDGAKATYNVTLNTASVKFKVDEGAGGDEEIGGTVPSGFKSGTISFTMTMANAYPKGLKPSEGEMTAPAVVDEVDANKTYDPKDHTEIELEGDVAEMVTASVNATTGNITMGGDLKAITEAILEELGLDDEGEGTFEYDPDDPAKSTIGGLGISHYKGDPSDGEDGEGGDGKYAVCAKITWLAPDGVEVVKVEVYEDTDSGYSKIADSESDTLDENDMSVHQVDFYPIVGYVTVTDGKITAFEAVKADDAAPRKFKLVWIVDEESGVKIEQVRTVTYSYRNIAEGAVSTTTD